MYETSDPIELESLLAKDSWLRSLARQLVSASDADDVAQDTWLDALRAGPDDLARGWLCNALRWRASGSLRKAERRERRETLALRTDAVPSTDAPSTDAVVERVELGRRLARFVTRLEEPYRGVILLRYYEGMEPQAIASARGVPAATVRSQIRRGLEQVRTKFRDEDGEDWRLALAPLSGLVSLGVAPLPVVATVAVVLLAAVLSLGAWVAFGLPARDAIPNTVGVVSLISVPAVPVESDEATNRRDPVIEEAVADATEGVLEDVYPKVAELAITLHHPAAMASWHNGFSLFVDGKRHGAYIRRGPKYTVQAHLQTAATSELITHDVSSGSHTFWLIWNQYELPLGTHEVTEGLRLNLHVPPGGGLHLQLQAPESEGWQWKSAHVAVHAANGTRLSSARVGDSGEVDLGYLPVGAYSFGGYSLGLGERSNGPMRGEEHAFWAPQRIEVREGDRHSLTLKLATKCSVMTEFPGGTNLEFYWVTHLATGTVYRVDLKETAIGVRLGLVPGDYRLQLQADGKVQSKRVQIYGDQRLVFSEL